MATLVLTAVGTALGGPIGGALGALAGRALDQAVLLKPRGRQGPRLADLQVQTSTYGSQVPQIFGAMRVAGTVIWATDLRESSNKASGGKGQPSVTTFSYSASFAVALSARVVRSVGRIWADGNLLRGAAGDFKSALGAFRLHDGSADQSVDPLIAAAQGIAVTPAHRGMAYAVFEDLALGDYGNRIPSLTFEVFADEGAVSVGAVAAALSGGAVGGAGGAVDGYAASGTDIGSALQPLVEAQGLVLREDAGALGLDGGHDAGVVARGSLAGRINGKAQVPVKAIRDPADAVPVRLALRHYDAARDYQAGIQTAVRPGAGRRAATIELAANMAAAEAKALAQARLAAAWSARSGLALLCGWDALVHAPGDIVSVEGESGRWRIVESEWEAMGVRLSLVRVAGASGGAASAVSAGSVVRQPDLPHGATTLMIADLPVLSDIVPSAPLVVVAAAGASAGWRKAALFTVDPGSGEAVAMGGTAAVATMGTVIVPPAAGTAMLFDAASSLEVEMLSDGMALYNADDAALARGANLCLVGEELLQFGSVVATGPRTVRLSRLLRGRRGTEWAMAGHGAGEAVLMIDADRLAAVPDAAVHVGEAVQVIGIGIGDAVPAQAERVVRGEALIPLAPVHGRVDSDGAGGWMIGWTRRSRAGWRWVDGVDAPLGEEREAYVVAVMDGADVVRSAEVPVPTWHYSAAMIAADGAAGPLSVVVRQVGSQALGRAVVVAL